MEWTDEPKNPPGRVSPFLHGGKVFQGVGICHDAAATATRAQPRALPPVQLVLATPVDVVSEGRDRTAIDVRRGGPVGCTCEAPMNDGVRDRRPAPRPRHGYGCL